MKKLVKISVLVIFILGVIILVFSMRGKQSQKYSKSDIDEVKAIATDSFKGWKQGCMLISLSYAGDEISEDNLSYCNQISSDNKKYTDCIVLYMAFKTGKDTLVFRPNTIYWGYNWIFAREEGKPWELVNFGYT